MIGVGLAIEGGVKAELRVKAEYNLMYVKIFRNGRYYLVPLRRRPIQKTPVLPTQTNSVLPTNAILPTNTLLETNTEAPSATLDQSTLPPFDLGKLTGTSEHGTMSTTIITAGVAIIFISMAFFIWRFSRSKALVSVAPQPNVDDNTQQPVESALGNRPSSIVETPDYISVDLTRNDTESVCSVQNTLIGGAAKDSDSLDTILDVYEPCKNPSKWSTIARKLARRSTESVATENMFPILSE